MFLKTIELSGYKSIRELKLDFQRMNVIIGANGAGKSNLISFLQMISELVNAEQNSTDYTINKAIHILYHGQNAVSQIKAVLSFANVDSDAATIKYQVILKANSKNELQLVSENVDGAQLSEVKKVISSWAFYRFHQASDLKIVHQLYSIYTDYPIYYKKIIAILRQILPFFDDFVWDKDNLCTDFSCFYWRERKSNMIFNTSQMSDGMVRMVSLITLLLQPNLPPLICIDEPELGLHPYAVNVLTGLIQATAIDTGVIISTQSVSLLDECSIQDVVVVSRRDGQSVFERLKRSELEDWLHDYSLGELWEKNILGGRP